MNGLSTKEFNLIAKRGMKFRSVSNNIHTIDNNEILTYIESNDSHCAPTCSSRKSNECKGHGVFLKDNRKIIICMSRMGNDDTLGHTLLMEEVEFIEVDEMKI